MKPATKLVIPRVLCYNNCKEPDIDTPVFHVRVSGFPGWKKIQIEGVRGVSIQINEKGRILSNGEVAGEVTRKFLDNSTRGTAIKATFHGRVLRAEMIRGFPSQFPTRQFYRLFSNDSEMGTMVCNTHTHTRFKIEMQEGRPDEAWFFGYCALVLRMGFDS